MTFSERTARQMRAIRRYAKALNLNHDQAAMRWCSTGCAERWADYNGAAE